MIAAALLVSACDVPSQQLQPSPEMQQILAACHQGDLKACEFAESTRQAELQRRASIPPPVFRPSYNNPADYQTRPAQQTTCRNSYGQIVCTTY